MTTILGINAFHGDAAACLVKDGILVAAAEEERFRRIKHWAGFPREAIRYCLAEAKLKVSDIDCIAVNHDARANLGRKLAFAVTKVADVALLQERVRNMRERAGIETHLAQAFPGEVFRGRIQPVEHHVAHLASAFYASPFGEAVAASIDGFGDFASAAWGIGTRSGIDVDARIFFPHSLGIFYLAMTQFLGFPHYGDEYKVMGLAAYGKPAYLGAMREIVRSDNDGEFRLGLEFFVHHREKIDYEWEDGAPSVGALYSQALVDLLGPPRAADESLGQRHFDLACSVQAAFEEALFRLLDMVHARYQTDALALAGGCANNSVANGKMTTNTPFRKLYVQAAPGDAGGALGAAWAASVDARAERPRAMHHAYWGPQFNDEAIGALLERRREEIAAANASVERIDGDSRLCRRVAHAVAEGKVVGWFQGRMEWGPRALGNRSILGDPRRAEMKEVLNRKIKRRESFRPFAPSILREAVNDWFDADADVPFMTEVHTIRADRRALIPAVTHVDGSGRIQTVDRETNPVYYRLIEAFRDLTGVPIVLNTSFNENEPIVCRPEEALDCFLRTRMDVLALGSFAIVRSAG
jgi:carbamoyltransferase